MHRDSNLSSPFLYLWFVLAVAPLPPGASHASCRPQAVEEIDDCTLIVRILSPVYFYDPDVCAALAAGLQCIQDVSAGCNEAESDACIAHALIIHEMGTRGCEVPTDPTPTSSPTPDPWPTSSSTPWPTSSRTPWPTSSPTPTPTSTSTSPRKCSTVIVAVLLLLVAALAL